MTDIFIQTIQQYLDPKRVDHSIRVKEMAVHLAKHYRADVDIVANAGIFHDIAKNQTPNALTSMGIDVTDLEECWKEYPKVWHAFSGPRLIRHHFGRQFELITDAIQYHTTGQKKMSLEAEIVFVADFIEPGRSFDTRLLLQEMAFDNIQRAVGKIAQLIMDKLNRNNQRIHPFTHACYQWYSTNTDEVALV